MVRYNEIVQEAAKKQEMTPERARKILEKYRRQITLTGKPTFNEETGRLDVDGAVTVRNFDKLPLSFGVVTGSFTYEMCTVNSLEDSPTIIDSYLSCSNNKNLTSLKNLPKSIGGRFFCWSNALTSLEGFEYDNSIGALFCVTYTPYLPLLRLCMASNGVNTNNQEIDNILNHCIKSEPILKKRIIECQYALIKAGYKDNAKW